MYDWAFHFKFTAHLANPIYLLSQTDQGGTRYRGIFSALRQIAQSEGVKGLYSGVSPTMQRASLVAAAELATYDEIKSRLISKGIMVCVLAARYLHPINLCMLLI
jgi:hypothetical protein